MSAAADQDFFHSSAQRPQLVQEAVTRIEAFLAKFKEENRTVVLVTSGGTSVPLEKNTVRSVENFSTGKRGAASAECFLRLGYGVIFLYRTGTACPFARHFQDALSDHIDFAFLDGLRLREKAGSILVQGKVDKHRRMVDALKEYHSYTSKGALLHLTYESVTEYLYLLQAASLALAPLKQNAMLYLAAAVSDFFVPPSEMEEHKIQSGAHSDGLHLHLKTVPKCLTLVRREWAPQSFVVSFKLETDPDMLLKKAYAAIDKYGVHLVVANLLHTRYKEVQLVAPASARRVELGAGVAELENVFVPAVAEEHYSFIGDSDQPFGMPPPLKPLSKPSSWWKEVDWGSVLFFLVVAPGVVIVSSAVQKQLMIQLGVKKR